MQRWPIAACADRFQRFFRSVVWSQLTKDVGGQNGTRSDGLETESRGPVGPPSVCDVDVVDETVDGQ